MAMEELDLEQLPLGATDFELLRKDGKIYVDKTDLLYKISRISDQPVFLSRPRRMGKSLLISAFECLFQQKMDLFAGMKIADLWKDNRDYRVMHLDFSSKAKRTAKGFRHSLCKFFDSWARAQGLEDYDPEDSDEPSDKFDAIADEMDKRELVLLIDEYDSPLVYSMDNIKKFESVKSVISDLFLNFKANSNKLRFFFITGVSKFTNINLFSDFNTFIDISQKPEYGNLLGFTSAELETYFKPFIARAASLRGVTYQETLEKIKDYYEGFCFERSASTGVHNPWSVLNFLANVSPVEGFLPYWTNTASLSSYVQEYFKPLSSRKDSKRYCLSLPTLEKNMRDTVMMPISMLERAYPVNKMPPTLMMLQSGFLTIKGVSGEQAIIGVPNKEIFKFLSSLALDHFYTSELLPDELTAISSEASSECIMNAASSGEPEEFANIFNTVVKAFTYDTVLFEKVSNLRELLYTHFMFMRFRCNSQIMNDKERSDIAVEIGNARFIFGFRIQREGQNANEMLKDVASTMIGRNYVNLVPEMKISRYAVVFSQENKCVARIRRVD